MNVQPIRVPQIAGGAAVRVVLADANHLVRAGVRHTLGRASRTRFEVLAEAVDAAGMIRAVSRHHPHLLIVDVAMENDDGLEAFGRCLGLQPHAASVVLTSRREPALAREAIASGALGYVFKDAEPAELLLAVGLALRGATYLAPGLAAELSRDHPTGSARHLSARERDVVRLIALGHTFAEIADRLHFSERTAKSCRATAAQTLGVSTRAQLTQWALDNGLVGSAQAA